MPKNKKKPEPQPAAVETVTASSKDSARIKLGFTLLMLALTALMLFAIFPPFYCAFFAPVCLVPLAICILRRPMKWTNLSLYYLCGVVFFAVSLYWMIPVTQSGFILLGMYLGLYFVAFAFVFHRLVNGLRVPAFFALPITWIAIEYVRGTMLYGGFPWFFLGNSLASAPLFIQTADLFGVWGVSFLIAMFNGFVVDMLRYPLKKDGKFNPMMGRLIAATAVTITFVIAYGVFRLNQQTLTTGPNVAVVQENIPQSIKDSGRNKPDIFASHIALSHRAALKPLRPDLIVWPETMIPGQINAELLQIEERHLSKAIRDDPERFKRALEQLADIKRYDAELRKLSNTTGASLLVGSPGQFYDPRKNDSAEKNTTLLYEPGTGQSKTYYAKRHLVPFGEFIPFIGLPIVGKYMINISPNGTNYSLTPGDEWTRFTLDVKRRAATDEAILSSTRKITFATPICFEDTMPTPARKMTAPQFGGGKKTDFLLNVSNDGWFYAGELNQHLQACQLRAVENRVPIARAVNTGNSGFIDSCGRIVKLVTGPDGSSIAAVGTETLTLQLDSRVTLFSQVGDVLPILCGVAAVLATGWTFVRPRRQK